jgi:DNA-binding MarR family transcriptional regulator
MDIAKRSMRGRLLSITSGRNISHTQLELLFTVHHMQPVSPKVLAGKLCLSPGAISQLIDALDGHRLIKRETDPTDRRRQVLSVSKHGQTMLKNLERKRRTVIENVIQDLSDEELTVWLRIQKKLIHEFQAAHTNKEDKE